MVELTIKVCWGAAAARVGEVHIQAAGVNRIGFGILIYCFARIYESSRFMCTRVDEGN